MTQDGLYPGRPAGLDLKEQKGYRIPAIVLREIQTHLQDFCFRFEDRRINCLTIVPHQDERQSSLASHGSMVLRLVIPDWMAGLIVHTCIRSRCAEQ